MLELNKIYCMDNVEGMKLLDDNSVDLIITSPPYDKIRAYNGFDWSFRDVALELFRIIKLNGVVVWIVGDATNKGNETGTSFKQALYFKEMGFNLYDTMIYGKTNPPLKIIKDMSRVLNICLFLVRVFPKHLTPY